MEMAEARLKRHYNCAGSVTAPQARSSTREQNAAARPPPLPNHPPRVGQGDGRAADALRRAH